MTAKFLSAALTLAERGWLAIPLAKDSQGFPKRPISDNWTHLALSKETIRALPWTTAVGIGIVLGPASGNLAVIDIDHPGLAEVIFPLLDTRSVRTIRGRGHLYVKEYLPSNSTRFTILWEGATVGIELKCAGTQVAAPPTPGYTLVNKSLPMLVNRIEEAWQSLAKQVPSLEIEQTTNGHTGYPPPWRQTVPTEERNKSAYVEAHRLREAGMPIALAIKYMSLRWREDYAQGDQEWPEIERTIQSAYSKPNGRGFL